MIGGAETKPETAEGTTAAAGTAPATTGYGRVGFFEAAFSSSEESSDAANLSSLIFARRSRCFLSSLSFSVSSG